MTEAAAAAPAAPTTPTAPVTPPSPPQPLPAAKSGQEGAEQAKAAARIELAKLDPNTIVVLTVDGEPTEMTAADAAKRLGRGESANKKFEAAAREREAIQREKAELTAAARELAEAMGDPLLARQGITPRQYAEAMIADEERLARMSPAERELQAYKEREAQARAEAERGQQQTAEAERAQHRDRFVGVFNQILSSEGIPEDAFSRSVLIPAMARAAMHVRKTQGRSITIGEARAVVHEALKDFGSLTTSKLTQEQRLAMITDDDFKAYVERQKANGRPQASPQLPRHDVRDPVNGQFALGNRGPGHAERGDGVRRNVNGKIIVKRVGDTYGR